MELGNYYTYLYLRSEGTPYYVGKGRGRRAWREHKGHNPPNNQELIILQEFESEAEAFEAEKFLISYYGRKNIGTGCLINRTDGGEGISGAILSEEKVKSQIFNMTTPRAKKKQIESLKKYNQDPKAREKNAAAQRKLWEDPEYRVWMTAKRVEQGSRGVSEATREKISKSVKSRPRKTHCKQGHERTSENTHKSGVCKICQKAYNSRYHKLAKEVSA